MKNQTDPESLPLPKGWTRAVKSAVLQLLALARVTMNLTLANADDDPDAKTEIGRLKQALAIRNEIIRIHSERMQRLSPHKRPRYKPTERLQILELKSAQGWSLRQTARCFHVAAATVAIWCKRVDEEGPDALLQMDGFEPINKFSDFVHYAVPSLNDSSERSKNSLVR